MNIGLTKVFQTGAKLKRWLMVGLSSALLNFHKLRGKLLFRLVWREPHTHVLCHTMATPLRNRACHDESFSQLPRLPQKTGSDLWNFIIISFTLSF